MADVLRPMLELSIVLPGLFLAYVPMKSYLKLSPGRAAARLLPLLLALIVGGGLGNVIDRIAYGHVIDFIELELIHFAVFNVADMAICIGAAIAAISVILDEQRRKRSA